MNQMEIFKNPEFGSVRVIDEDGKYLFCGTDVSKGFGVFDSQQSGKHPLQRGFQNGSPYEWRGTKALVYPGRRRLPPHCPQQAALGGAI